MFEKHLNTCPRISRKWIRALLVSCAVMFSCAVGAEAGEKKVIVSNIRVENDIGVENAGPIMTKWLIDSIIDVAPNVRVVPGDKAANLARLRSPVSAEDISPAIAQRLMKAIHSTHLLGGYIFLLNRKYGITLKLTDLSDTERVRVERGWAESTEEIPDRIEELARRLFSPLRETAEPNVSPAPAKDRRPAPETPARVALLLKKHPEMVYVPGGEFPMGNQDDSDAENMPVDPARRAGVSRFVLLAAEKPEHIVNLEPFLIDKYEVTNAQYRKFKPDHVFPSEKADHPVTGISWYDAQAYAGWAGKRLPTEQEWEKSARGVDGRKWPWGNVFKRGKCNLGSDTAPVGSFEGDKSPGGVYDMAGNVQEWTSSEFKPYPGNTSNNIRFDTNKKVVRGSYYGGNDFLARCSMRFCALPGKPNLRPQGQNYGFIGFRCAMDIR